MYNYINYSFIFFKLWGLNKLLFGIPYYLIEHLIITNIINISYESGKMIIKGIGNGIYYLAFPKPLEVINVPKTHINSDDLDDKNNHLDKYIDTLQKD